MPEHPFLAEKFHIRWSQLVPEKVEVDIEAGILEAQQRIDEICSVPPEQLTYGNTFAALEAATESLSRGWGRLNHLSSVRDNDAQRSALNKMLPPFQLGLGGPLGQGRHWQSWIGLDDAARHIMHLCTAPVEDVRGVHNVVAPEPIQQRDFASALGKALQRPAWLPTPRWAVQLLFGDMAKEALLASTRVVPTRRLEEGPSFLTPDLEDALRHALRRKSER